VLVRVLLLVVLCLVVVAVPLLFGGFCSVASVRG